MQPFHLEMPYVPGEGWRTSQLLIAGTLVLGGVALALSRRSLIPLLLSFAGVYLYGWLLYRHPQYEYFLSLQIGEQGIEYAREPKPVAPRAVLRWSEVKSVSARLTSEGEEVQGLEVVSLKYGAKGVRVLLPVSTEAECRAAEDAAKFFRNAYATGAG